MENKNLIVINGNELPFEPGETILEVSRRANIDIPTLCHIKGTTPTGACRICVVEVKGARTLLPSCSTPAAPNMVVRTESPEVVAARKEILHLMLSSGNHNCAVRGRDDGDFTPPPPPPSFNWASPKTTVPTSCVRCGGIAASRIWPTAIR